MHPLTHAFSRSNRSCRFNPTAPYPQAFRILTRIYGADLVYTPMVHAAHFADEKHAKAAHDMFDTRENSLEGVAPYDRPLIVQFCANDPELLVAAARRVAGRCDAIDLNLGCPQAIAKRGNYGAFLMDDWPLVERLISTAHTQLTDIPVTAKIRVYPTEEKTLEYARHVRRAGAQLLTVHGRIREAKGRLAGYASWPRIRSVVNDLGEEVAVLANGGLPDSASLAPCLEETGADGLMSAEGALYNPLLFNAANAERGASYLRSLDPELQAELDGCARYASAPCAHERRRLAPATLVAAEYLTIVRWLIGRNDTGASAIKSHLFKFFRPVFDSGRHLDVRNALGSVGHHKDPHTRVDAFFAIVDMLHERLKSDIANGLLSSRALECQTVDDEETRDEYSYALPYYRVTCDTVAPEASSGDKPETGVPDSEKKGAHETHDAADSEGRAQTAHHIGKHTREESVHQSSKVSVIDPDSQRLKDCGSGCGNKASLKCVDGHCMGCCDNVACIFHQEKKQRNADRRESKRQRRNQRKANKNAKDESKDSPTTMETEEADRARSESLSAHPTNYAHTLAANETEIFMAGTTNGTVPQETTKIDAAPSGMEDRSEGLSSHFRCCVS